jgi:Predicted acetamidase/formamidase
MSSVALSTELGGRPRPRTHHLPDEQVHFTWDTANEPVLVIDSGDTVVVWTRDVSDNQIGPDSEVGVIAGLDWDRVYPLSGPIGIRGAEPGDTIAIEVLDIHTQGWGWTAVLPGLGLLPDDFPDAYLRIFDLSPGDVAYICARTSPFRSSRFSGPWGCARLARRPSR